jgi:hypothetical protein
MKKALMIGLMLLTLCVLISLPFPVGGAGALNSPWPTPWELTPPHRPTPTGGYPPPISAITPIAHQQRAERSSGLKLSIVPVTPVAMRSATPALARVRVRARVSVSAIERCKWETWKRHNID